jgi:alcohol dehydrogenase YqhD (iron-dependent ADH family)
MEKTRMKNFIFQAPTKIIFGSETESSTGKEVKKHGNKVLLHYGAGSIKTTGLYKRIVESLKNEKVDFIELGGVKPNPRLGLVYEGIELCRRNKIDFILAVGGGSVIDSAKAIGIGSSYEGDVWDFYTGKAKVAKTIPVGVVLTIPAAGSEVSGDSVITNEEGLYKKATGAEIMRPRFSILNPELTFTLNAKQTAAGVCDIMAHVFERYFTTVKNVELTDRLAEATLVTVINNLKICLENLSDYNSRAEIMWCGSVAHNNLLATGKTSDWGSHMIEHELSAIYDIPHGEGLAIIFPAWMKYVYKSDIKRFAQFANRVFNINIYFDDLEKAALEGIKALEDFYIQTRLPTKLSQIGIGSERFEEMASKCTEGGPVGQFVKLSYHDVLNIYKLAL